MAIRPQRRNDVSAAGRSPKRSGTKLWGLAAGAVAVVTAAGLIVSLSTGSSSVPDPSGATPSHSKPAPNGTRGRVVMGVPVGYPRTEAGAKAAAANCTTVRGSSSFLDDASARHRALSVMTASSAASTATDEADYAARQAVTQLRGDNKKVSRREAIARTGVFSAQLLGFDIHRTMVRLWTTAVRGSAVGHTTPQANFQTVTVTLVWEHNDWKMTGTSSTDGPVAPIDTDQATNVTSDFSDYIPARAADAIVSGATASDGFPAAYERSEQGARAAATSAVMLYGDPRFFTGTAWRLLCEAKAAIDFATDPLGFLLQKLTQANIWFLQKMLELIDNTTKIDLTSPGFLKQYAIIFAASTFMTVALWLIAVAKRAVRGVSLTTAVSEAIGFLALMSRVFGAWWEARGPPPFTPPTRPCASGAQRFPSASVRTLGATTSAFAVAPRACGA